MQSIQGEMVKKTTNWNILQGFANECYIGHLYVVL